MLLIQTYFSSDDVTVAVTDVHLTKTNFRDLVKTSFVACTVVTSPFTGLARCDDAEVYGRYVFVQARSEMGLQLCEVEVFAFRECHDIAIAATATHYAEATAVHSTSATAIIGVATYSCRCHCGCCCCCYSWCVA